MGNGEEYIWKPPEEDDITAPPGPPPTENGQTVVEVSDESRGECECVCVCVCLSVYSVVCVVCIV